HGVVRMAVMANCRSSRFYLGIALNNKLRVTLFHVIVKAAVAVEVVEVLKQGEVQSLFYIWIWLVSGKVCSKVDSHLFIAKCGFYDSLVCRIQPVDRLLLHGIHASHRCHLAFDLRIDSHSFYCMGHED